MLTLVLISGCASGGGGGYGGGETPTETPTPTPTGPTEAEIVGTWVVDDSPPVRTTPFLTIVGGGTWTGSDGCNGVQGTWKLGVGGALTTTSGPHTLIACDGRPLPTLFADAKYLEVVDGDRLVLKDAGERVTGTLVRGREPLIPLSGG